MELVLRYSPSRAAVSTTMLLWLGLAVVLPTKLGNFNFRHFSDSEGLVIKMSRSAPPLAALVDERLPVIKIEPPFKKAEPHARLLAAGDFGAIYKIQRIISKHNAIEIRIARKAQKKLSTISQLVKLIRPLTPQGAVASADKIATSREINADTLRAPNVWRGIPRGEEEIYVETINSVTSHSGAIEDTATTQPKSEISQPASAPAVGGYWPQAKVQKQERWKIAPVNDQPSIQSKPAAKKDLIPKENSIMMASLGDTAQKGVYKILGRVELSGGLALTGYSTKLDVQLTQYNRSLPISIDSSTGEFAVDVPTLQTGSITARLLDSHGYPLGTGEFDLEGSATADQAILEGVKVVIEPLQNEVKGRVISSYSDEYSTVAMKNAEIFAPNGYRELTQANGQFYFSTLSRHSTYLLEAYAQDHWGTRVLSEGKRRETIPVFPHSMMQSFFDILKEGANNSELGVVWGQVKRRSKTMEGVKVSLSTSDAIGPIYFNALRIPDKTLKATTANGLFAFIKVKPGLHVVSATYNDKELPSAVVSTSPSVVSYTQIGFKLLKLKGRVFDPVEQRNIESEVGVIGSTATTRSSEAGFELKTPSSDAVVFVEARAGSEYYVSRTAVPRSESKEIDLYALKKSWLDSQLNNLKIKQNSQNSVIFGYVKGPAYQVSLDLGLGQGGYSDENIHYFDAQGNIQEGLSEGIQGGGGFILTNVPPGLHTVLVSAATGEFLTSRVAVSEPGIVDIVSLALKP